MHIAVYLSLVLAAALAVAGPGLGRRLPPGTALRLLTAAAFLAATASCFILAVLAWTLLAQLPAMAGLGHWSVPVLRAANPVPVPVAAAAGAVLVALAAGALTAAMSRCAALAAAGRTCRRLGPGPLVVLDEPAVAAYAVPGLRGRVVATRGLLQALSAAERRVVLAHETAHLHRRHAWWLAAVDIAAAANPLLLPLAAVLHEAAEREADEDAAASCGDRRLAARTLARVALLTTPNTAARPTAPGVLTVTGGVTVRRVQALLAPRPQSRPVLALTVLALLATTLITTMEAAHDTEGLFEHAMHTAATPGAPPER